ncbi:ubiquinone/menaquinone biosynthesis C-methylase UbiE [Labrenzia sp. MBR-25]|jgi:ubiquinone/menaquinone biosynthesis C-methylase UbiE
MEVVYLVDHKISEKTVSVQKAFEKEYLQRYGKARSKGLYRFDDWKRIDFCISRISEIGGTVLDVGVGPGGLLNLLKSSNNFTAPIGIDIREYSKLVRLHEDLDIRLMDVGNMGFETNAFDVVVCMEVLEHLDENHFKKALQQLRRVARKAIFMTVPLCEPEPLPVFHKQRFDYIDIKQHFSKNAEFFILQPKTGVPWIAILEYLDRPVKTGGNRTQAELKPKIFNTIRKLLPF